MNVISDLLYIPLRQMLFEFVFWKDSIASLSYFLTQKYNYLLGLFFDHKIQSLFISSYTHKLFIILFQEDDAYAKNYLIQLSFCGEADANAFATKFQSKLNFS